MNRAHLQQYVCEKTGRRMWFDEFVYLAHGPLVDRGFEIRTFVDPDDLEVAGTSDVLLGSVESTRRMWEMMGVWEPDVLGFPESSVQFLDRRMWECKLSEAFTGSPVFVKPASRVKLFTGCVLDTAGSYELLLQFTDGLTGSDRVLCSDPVSMLSEYRCFVHKGRLVGMKHYLGDFGLFPDMRRVRQMVELISPECPVSYALDVAVTGSGMTVLVELNDFWAVGGYGLDGRTYVRMLVDRFQEVIRGS